MSYDVKLPKNVHPTKFGFRAMAYFEGKRQEKRFASIADAIEWLIAVHAESGVAYRLEPQHRRRTPEEVEAAKIKAEAEAARLAEEQAQEQETEGSTPQGRITGPLRIERFSLAVELGIEIPDDYMPELKYR